MKTKIAAGGILIAAMLGSIAFAEPPTQPMAPTSQPTTQPMAADVYLVPFSCVSGDNSLDWAGKAVQQNLLTDLARAKLHVIASDKPIANTTDAQTAAKSAGAKYILTGTYQVADTLVRFTGQILEASSGNVLGGISATGAPRDLFSMEDALSAQALGQLTKLPAMTTANKPAGPVPAGLQQPIVVQVIQPPAVAQAGSTSSYNGSSLQQYVDANRTPSTDYNQQVQDAQDRNTFDYGYNNLYNNYFGGFGYGIGYYPIITGGYRYGGGYGYHHGWDR